MLPRLDNRYLVTKVSALQTSMDDVVALYARWMKKRPELGYGRRGSFLVHGVEPNKYKRMESILVDGRINPSTHGAHGRGAVYTWNDIPQAGYLGPGKEGFLLDRARAYDLFDPRAAAPGRVKGLNFRQMTLLGKPATFGAGDVVVLGEHLDSPAAEALVRKTGITPVTTEQFQSVLDNVRWGHSAKALSLSDEEEIVEKLYPKGLRKRVLGTLELDPQVERIARELGLVD